MMKKEIIKDYNVISLILYVFIVNCIAGKPIKFIYEIYSFDDHSLNDNQIC